MPDKSVYDPPPLWINQERTILVRTQKDGTLEIATRETPDHTWGPPITLHKETN